MRLYSSSLSLSLLAFGGDRSVGTQLLLGRKTSFDGDGDRNLAVLLAVSLLCSAGQPFSHQFDMHGILLSSKEHGSERVDHSPNVKEGY